MVKKVEVLAIVPARGGSWSLPRKNIQLLGGVPLIAYSIAAGKQARLVDRVIVSTDDNEIAEVARKWGAETPFMRPAKYARNKSHDLEFFTHALDWLKRNEGYVPDVVVQLRPTSPIRPVGMVDKAIKVLLNHPKADSVRGVVPAGQNPHKMWKINDFNKPMKNLLKVSGIEEPYNAPRQQLPLVYWQTGHVDVIRTQTILNGSVSGKVIYPLLIDSMYAVDIDSQFNLDYAKLLLGWFRTPIVRPKKR